MNTSRSEPVPPGYRLRKGKLVKIPEEWLGLIPHRQTVRKRRSKGPRKWRDERDSVRDQLKRRRLLERAIEGDHDGETW